MAAILLVDDDRSLTSLLQRVLELEGYQASVASDGHEALRSLRDRPHDLVLLDYQLPDATGAQVFERIRQQSEVPVIMLSGRTGNDAIVSTLDQGADDYVTKPFEPRELLARIRVVLRRAGQPARLAGRRLTAGPVAMDPDAHEVACNGSPVSLTPTEFQILQLLLRNVGRVLTFEQIIQHCWSLDGGGSEALVRVHVSRLRKKLSACGGDGLIRSQAHVGYGITVRQAAA